jgi:hypothetical protein
MKPSWIICLCVIFTASACETLSNAAEWFFTAPSIFEGTDFDHDRDSGSGSDRNSDSVPEKKTNVDRRTFRNNTYAYMKVTVRGGENVSEREFVISSKSSKSVSYEGSPTFAFDFPMNMCYITFDGADVFSLEYLLEYKDRYK